jgi:hypothetical protein
MFVYGNGKWHKVRNVEDAERIKLFITYCGCSYNDYFNTSRDQAIRESRYFCPKCYIEMSQEPDEGKPKPP